MEQYHGKSKTTYKGRAGRKRTTSNKKLSKVGGPFIATKIGDEDEVKIVRARGGNEKVKRRKAQYVNVSTKEAGKAVIKKAKIKTVLESPENRHHARMGIITKGSILDTDLGKVKITSRPGQSGIISGVLLS